ncbi:hypothetical protein [Bacillus marinisedimentorum]|uniref:hypothetical protein n=1 Tax=Bacillus marinisedimentorum TaxID=1821260 RepID=UPI000871FDDC|nr:hypothetical protein [Bacillus marinisedimentorum]
MSDASLLIGHFFLMILILDLTIRLFRMPRRRPVFHTVRTLLYVVLFSLHLAVFLIIFHWWTFQPGIPSGSFNTALSIMIPEAVLFLVFLFILAKQLSTTFLQQHPFISLAWMLAAGAVLIFLIQLEIKYAGILHGTLDEKMNPWWLWWKDQHKNSLYFNIFSYGIGITSAILTGIASALFRSSLKKNRHPGRKAYF